MKRLLIVLCAFIATPAWGQPGPTGPTAGSAVPPSVEGNVGSGSAGTGVVGGASSPDTNPSVPGGPGEPKPSGTPTPIAPTVAGSGSGSGAGSGSAAQPPPLPMTIVPGAIETSADPKEPCGALATKPWYEQLTCKPHVTWDTFWMPIGANEEGDGVDTMFYATLALSAFFFIAITAVVVVFVIKYRGRKGHRAQPSPSHNDTMEITWTVIPTIIVVFLFYYGWRGYINMVTPPNKAVEVQVVAQKWSWSFVHANGVSDGNLHVPVDTPVRLVMTSTDVLHSFFVPALRTKQDVIPRRYTYVWFKATKPGTYRLYCTEYCGRDHSQMKVKVVVHESQMYERYLAERAEADNTRPLDQIGADQYNKRPCNSCHSLDGSTKVGPSFKDTFGTEVTLSDGSKVKMDENYIRESLMSPQAKARPNYPPSMPSFANQLKERQILGLIEFIKKQSKHAEAPADNK
jgi:cytochrome c oxidase subunit 2